MLGVSGVTATYLPAGGLAADEITVRGDFYEKYERIDPVTMQLISTSPALGAVTEEIPNAKAGDRLLISGTYYHVNEQQEDGLGVTLLILSKDTQLPITPSRLSVELAGGNAVLTWTRNATNNTAVEVWSDPSNTGVYSRLATLGASVVTYTDTSGVVAAGYKLRNTNKSGPSPFSHIFNTILWALVDENNNYIVDEVSSAMEARTQ